MGLTWIIQPIPDDEAQRRQHDHEFTFRAENLNDIPLPDSALATAITDMNAWQMEEYAETLLNEITLRENTYSNTDKQLITEAAEWLQYWASKNKELIAWY